MLRNIESPMGGWTQVTTAKGEVVTVEVTREHLGIVVGGEVAARVPYPSAGYGGHELLLSANERYLVMWLYSGQCEVGYAATSSSASAPQWLT